MYVNLNMFIQSFSSQRQTYSSGGSRGVKRGHVPPRPKKNVLKSALNSPKIYWKTGACPPGQSLSHRVPPRQEIPGSAPVQCSSFVDILKSNISIFYSISSMEEHTLLFACEIKQKSNWFSPLFKKKHFHKYLSLVLFYSEFHLYKWSTNAQSIIEQSTDQRHTAK